jgi:uncharacterized Zn ribbon protein
MTTDCPQCGMENAYFDGTMYVCPDCDYEWSCDFGEVEDDDWDDLIVVINYNLAVVGVVVQEETSYTSDVFKSRVKKKDL